MLNTGKSVTSSSGHEKRELGKKKKNLIGKTLKGILTGNLLKMKHKLRISQWRMFSFIRNQENKINNEIISHL